MLCALTCSMVPSVPFFTLHAKAALVLQEHDAIPAGEISRAAFDRHTHLIPRIAGCSHPLARCVVECAHLVIDRGEDDPAPIR
jgi:hypothetical protein